MNSFAILGVASMIAIGSVTAATVFFDDFRGGGVTGGPATMPWQNRVPTIGDGWRLDAGAANDAGKGGVFSAVFGGFGDTSMNQHGGSYNLIGDYAGGQILGAGDTIFLEYTSIVSGGTFPGGLSGAGWAGIELLVDDGSGDGARIFTGVNNGGHWFAQGAGGVSPLTGITNSGINLINVDISLAYEFDTGKVVFGVRQPGPSGQKFSYVGYTDPGLAFDSLRITTSGEGDMAINNVRVVIVPEPASATLLGLGLLGLMSRRRRA